jgi:hypothetical protein
LMLDYLRFIQQQTTYSLVDVGLHCVPPNLQNYKT